VFALMSRLKGGSEAASPAAAIMPVASEGIVLPRFLRRPARLLGRLTDGNFEAPRYSASILTIGLLSVAGIYGAYLGGQFPIVVQSVTSRLGFAIDEVKVSGNHETSEIDILDRLDGLGQRRPGNARAVALASLQGRCGQRLARQPVNARASRGRHS